MVARADVVKCRVAKAASAAETIGGGAIIKKEATSWVQPWVNSTTTGIVTNKKNNKDTKRTGQSFPVPQVPLPSSPTPEGRQDNNDEAMKDRAPSDEEQERDQAPCPPISLQDAKMVSQKFTQDAMENAMFLVQAERKLRNERKQNRSTPSIDTTTTTTRVDKELRIVPVDASSNQRAPIQTIKPTVPVPKTNPREEKINNVGQLIVRALEASVSATILNEEEKAIREAMIEEEKFVAADRLCIQDEKRCEAEAIAEQTRIEEEERIAAEKKKAEEAGAQRIAEEKEAAKKEEQERITEEKADREEAEAIATAERARLRRIEQGQEEARRPPIDEKLPEEAKRGLFSVLKKSRSKHAGKKSQKKLRQKLRQSIVTELQEKAGLQQTANTLATETEAKCIAEDQEELLHQQIAENAAAEAEAKRNAEALEERLRRQVAQKIAAEAEAKRIAEALEERLRQEVAEKAAAEAEAKRNAQELEECLRRQVAQKIAAEAEAKRIAEALEERLRQETAEKLVAEVKAEAMRVAQARRQEVAQKAEQERIEAERIAAEEKAEQERIAAEKAKRKEAKAIAAAESARLQLEEEEKQRKIAQELKETGRQEAKRIADEKAAADRTSKDKAGRRKGVVAAAATKLAKASTEAKRLIAKPEQESKPADTKDHEGPEERLAGQTPTDTSKRSRNLDRGRSLSRDVSRGRSRDRLFRSLSRDKSRRRDKSRDSHDDREQKTSDVWFKLPSEKSKLSSDNSSFVEKWKHALSASNQQASSTVNNMAKAGYLTLREARDYNVYCSALKQKFRSDSLLVQGLINELIRFLALKIFVHELPYPSPDIENAWSVLMLFPQTYSEVCVAMGSSEAIPFHTESVASLSRDAKKERYSLTLSTYSALFNEKPPNKIWWSIKDYNANDSNKKSAGARMPLRRKMPSRAIDTLMDDYSSDGSSTRTFSEDGTRAADTDNYTFSLPMLSIEFSANKDKIIELGSKVVEWADWFDSLPAQKW